MTWRLLAHVAHIKNGLPLPYYGVELVSILEYTEYVEHIYYLKYVYSLEYL